MAAPRMKIAELKPKDLKKVKDLEKDLGAVIVALTPRYSLADLSRKQVKKIRAAEKKLGVVLMAYQP